LNKLDDTWRRLSAMPYGRRQIARLRKVFEVERRLDAPAMHSDLHSFPTDNDQYRRALLHLRDAGLVELRSDPHGTIRIRVTHFGRYLLRQAGYEDVVVVEITSEVKS
jgi:hypothetical protein